jgi:hypothetical protein
MLYGKVYYQNPPKPNARKERQHLSQNVRQNLLPQGRRNLTMPRPETYIVKFGYGVSDRSTPVLKRSMNTAEQPQKMPP